MLHQRIASFTHFVADSQRSLDEVCKFLILHTFADMNPKSFYLGQIEVDGDVVLRSAFGFDPNHVLYLSRISITAKMPFIDSLRNNEPVILNSQKEILDKYKDLGKITSADKPWKSCITAPIHSDGAFMILTNDKVPAGEEFHSFLKSIGSLLAIQLHYLNAPIRSKKNDGKSPQELTKRQVIIKNLLEKGFTNSQIALEIGYSESLVRQESISIYAALNVSGRKDLIKLVSNQSATD